MDVFSCKIWLGNGLFFSRHFVYLRATATSGVVALKVALVPGAGLVSLLLLAEVFK